MYKLVKPITAGARNLVALDRCNLYKGGPVKALVRNVYASVGRNNAGKITVRRGGGGRRRA